MGGGNLPNEIVQAIAVSNAKSIGEQPAILSNLALATQILNTNMQQQLMLAQQQALNQIVLATTAKCVSLITQSGQGKSPVEEADAAVKAVKEVNELAEQFMKQVSSLFPQPQAQATAEQPPPQPDPEGGKKK